MNLTALCGVVHKMYSSPIDHYYPGSTSTYSPDGNPARMATLSSEDEDKYVVTSKIMVAALVVLFIVVLFVISLHMYAKWVWSTTSEGRRGRGPAPYFSFWPRRRSSLSNEQVVAHGDVLEINIGAGLDKSALEALPTFRYKIGIEHLESNPTSFLECAICLRNFEEDDLGRSLPGCGHSFHLECIDMWLYSHSTCPLCRAILEPQKEVEPQPVDSATTVIQVSHSEFVDTSRGLRGRESPDQSVSTQSVRGDQMDEHTRAEQLPELSQTAQPLQGVQEHERDKRTDSIPSNILFWGNNTQQLNEDSRFDAAVNTNSVQPPLQIAIDIDRARAIYQHVRAEHHPSSSDMSNSSPPTPSFSDVLASPISRTAASFRRLLSRGGQLPSSTAATAITERVHENSARLSS